MADEAQQRWPHTGHGEDSHQGDFRLVESQGHSNLGNVRLDSSPQDDMWGWTQEAKLKYRAVNMFFPRKHERLQVYLPNKNKWTGFFQETTYTGKSQGSSVLAAPSKALYAPAPKAAFCCPCLHTFRATSNRLMNKHE